MKTTILGLAAVAALCGAAPPPVMNPPLVHATTAPSVTATMAPGGPRRATPTPSPSPGALGHPTPAPNPVLMATRTRIVYGTIASFTAATKTFFIMRLRSGIVQRVDATQAIRTGRYSYPLFIGKYVAVTGKVQTTGILEAETISRAPNLKNMPEDRWIVPAPTPRP